MLELLYTLFLLVVMNFYLKIRRGTLSATQRFMISLMGIAIVFGSFMLVGHLFADRLTKLYKMDSPAINIGFMLTMTVILPSISAEIILAIYERFLVKKKK